MGWALTTPELLKGMGVHHSNTSFCSPSPLQHGLSVALDAEDGSFEVRASSLLDPCYRVGFAKIRRLQLGVALFKPKHFAPMGLFTSAAAQQFRVGFPRDAYAALLVAGYPPS